MTTVIFLIIFGAISLIGFLGFLVKLKQFFKVNSYKGRTNAEIVAIKEEEVKIGKNESETYYSPIIKYSAGGVIYRKTYTFISDPAKQRIGSLIPIRYDTKNPSDIAPEKMTTLFAQTLGFLIMGVGMIIFISNVVL